MNFKAKLLATVSIMAISFSAPAFAAGEKDSHSHHAAVTRGIVIHKSKPVKEYILAMNRMHQNMETGYSGDADIDFVRGMIPHHQGAVDMAKIELKYGKDEELRSLAQRIILAQEEEIGFMKNWLSGHDNGHNDPAADGEPATAYFKKAMYDMHKQMMIEYSGNADIDFARGMIPHHQGAIEMARILKKYGKQEDLRPMLDDIIRSQSQEIEFMKEWLEANKTKK